MGRCWIISLATGGYGNALQGSLRGRLGVRWIIVTEITLFIVVSVPVLSMVTSTDLIPRFRSEDRKYPHLANGQHQNHRFRTFESVRPLIAFIDILWLSLLCCARTPQCQGVHWPRGGCMEFWCRALCVGVWKGPF